MICAACGFVDDVRIDDKKFLVVEGNIRLVNSDDSPDFSDEYLLLVCPVCGTLKVDLDNE